MKAITKTLAITAASTCLLFTTTTLASSAASHKGVNQAQDVQVKKNAPVRLLSVFQAQNATLKHIKGNEYEFSFPINKNSKVLVFSDRPNRIAFTMSRNKWAKMVITGSNSFKKDAPNIVITWNDSQIRPTSYTISGYKELINVATYKLNALEGSTSTKEIAATTRGGAEVFMDGFNYGNNCKTSACWEICYCSWGKPAIFCAAACENKQGQGS